ncbi:MAG: glycosyltransferase family 4 protein [Myxococcales bacterium]
MRIGLVGGIFGRSAEHRAIHRHTPETTLARGLAALGHRVDTLGHEEPIRSEQYDVIHVHHVGRAAYWMATSPRVVPFVFTGHDAMMLSGFEENPLRRAAFREVVHRCDAAVALSHAEAGFLQGFARPPRVEVIPNGIPAEAYQATSLDGAPERRGLVFAGQLIPMKGVETLLRAMALLQGRRGLKLTLAYHNPELEQPLQKLAAELGLAEVVRFAGPQTPAQLAQLYRGAEAFVLPSYAESLPSVITEALLAGTPVVSTTVGGIREQVGEFGALVPPGDPSALAQALEHVLDHPPALERRQAMREHALARSSPSAMVEAHLRLYESLVSKSRSVPRRGQRLDPALRAAIWAYWGFGKAALGRTTPA